jgi:glycosyltransferase involved in cell wall biosynthesis
VKQLAAIHDINFAHRPKDLPWLTSKYYNYFFPRFARKARRIVTVSFFSKEDIARTYKIDQEKIDVVYNGVNTQYTPISEKKRSGQKSGFSGGKIISCLSGHYIRGKIFAVCSGLTMHFGPALKAR